MKKIVNKNININSNYFILALFFSLFFLNFNAQTVETVAGVQGVTGNNNGVVSIAKFNNPHGIEVDLIGNIFVADRFNHLIRKIDTSGNVTTIAGSGVSGSQDGQGGSVRKSV